MIPRSIADEGTPRGTEYDVVPKLTEEARILVIEQSMARRLLIVRPHS